MELSEDLKQTPVGLIPASWAVEPLGDYVTITSGASPSLFVFGKGSLPYFKVEQLSNSHKYLSLHSTPYHFRTGPTVPPRSIVFAKRGAAIALNKIRILDDAAFMDTNLMSLTPTAGLDPEYLYYALGHIGLWRFADTTSVPQINNKHIKPLLFILPNEEEQRAIATALSDVDALIAGLERLIAKKRDIKQAAMQQLLSGQTRLPGFSGKWQLKRLGDCLVSHPDYGINAAAVEYSDRLPTYLRITDITEDGCFKPDPRVSVNSAASGQYLLSDGDVVFARTGASVGKSYRYRTTDGPLVFAGFLIRVRPDSTSLDPKYLATYVASKAYWNWVTYVSMRSGQPGINGNELAQMPIELPSVAEQAAIAAVISDMDAELAAIGTRLVKTQALKQGMMQELLTGRTRLI